MSEVHANDHDQAHIRMDTHATHVLLIEPNPVDAYLIRTALDQVPGARFCSQQVATVAEGCAFLHDHVADLVLFSLDPADAEAVSAFHAVHARNEDVPILVLIGGDDESFALTVVQAGAQDCLRKQALHQDLLQRAIRYAIERKRVENRLRTYKHKLRSLTAELSRAEERERRRISQDLHDSLGTLLAVSKMKVAELQATVTDVATVTKLGVLRGYLEEAIACVRSLIAEISPPLLYELGLEEAIRWLADRMLEQHHLAITVTVHGEPCSLPDEISAFLYRAVRELVMNIIKHAQATTAHITIAYREQQTRIVVEDDGVGFIATPAAGLSYGLFSIGERIFGLGGHMRIDESPLGGTRVTVAVPIDLQTNQPDDVVQGAETPLWTP